MLNQAIIKAFIPTINPSLSKKFYQEILGLNLISEDDYALEFEANGTKLRITTVESYDPYPFTVLGWNVSDIETVVHSLKRNDIVFETFDSLNQNAAGIWISPSKAKVAWFKDPNGNLLSLTQMPH